jgi:hypothetical protein
MRSTEQVAAVFVIGFATWVAGLAGCRKSSSEGGSTGDAAAPPRSGVGGAGEVTPVMTDAGPRVVRIIEDSGPLASGIPVPASKVEAAVNPGGAAPYAGPTGAVEGIIAMTGEPPPKRDIDIPFGCGEAYASYGKAFREGNGRTLADVLVAVTGYSGFVPAGGDFLPVKIHGCAYDHRTLVLTYGQRIEVSNTDPKEAFLPTLEGAIARAQMVAVPGGDPVKLYPTEVGHYALREGTNHNWMDADVFVVRYPTAMVTDLDGHYRIAGIPVGKVKVSAYLPLIDAQLHPDVGISAPTQEREVDVSSGETAQADFVFSYKKPKNPPKPKPAGTDRPIIK